MRCPFYKIKFFNVLMVIILSPTTELPIILFESQLQFAHWLAEHQNQSTGLWLKLAKKGADVPSVTYDEAVETALCYGWIDGQKKGFDEKFWLQKFTPRRSKSIWSKINREKAERLIASGEMRPAGLAAVELAKQDGRWEAAYDSQRTITVPEDFQAELDKSPKAKAFFESLTSAKRYSFLFRIQTAKKLQTREMRIHQFVEMLQRGETF
jgi:uncharacterized protein YdeI (YjbR/CyaY-like superfamily)